MNVLENLNSGTCNEMVRIEEGKSVLFVIIIKTFDGRCKGKC